MSNWINGNLTGTLSIGQGERGKSLEYEWRGTELGIRVEGEEYQFVNLAGEGTGTGREIELQVGNGYIQWRYKDEEEWNNLISIDSLKGEQGIQGLPGKDGTNGENGKSLEYNWNGTQLGVKREDEDSYSYVDLKGRDGKDGKNGIDGTNGQDGVTPNIQVGTVTTLEPGEKATVVNSGTKENPVFDFGIPRGAGSSEYELLVDYTYNEGKVVMPSNLDLDTGIYTCDSPHGLVGNEKVILYIKNPAFLDGRYIPKEIWEFNWVTMYHLIVEVISETDFKLKESTGGVKEITYSKVSGHNNMLEFGNWGFQVWSRAGIKFENGDFPNMKALKIQINSNNLCRSYNTSVITEESIFNTSLKEKLFTFPESFNSHETGYPPIPDYVGTQYKNSSYEINIYINENNIFYSLIRSIKGRRNDCRWGSVASDSFSTFNSVDIVSETLFKNEITLLSSDFKYCNGTNIKIYGKRR